MELDSNSGVRIPLGEEPSNVMSMIDDNGDGDMKLNGSTDDDEYHDQDWGSNPGMHEKCNLIINYLPHEIDDATLKTLFMEHGEIAIAKVVKDKATKKSLGYGFVKFMKEEDALAAIELKNGFITGHKKLKVSIARPPSLEIRNCKLYITNLPKEYSDREVVELFSQFGDIIECRVLKDRNAKVNKGVAFVQFNLKNQANSALSLNGYRPPGHDRHLVVKYAEDQHRKKERRVQPLGVVGMMGMGSPLSKQDPRDPYFYARSRMPSMYNNQSNPIQLVHSPVGNQVYLPATSVVYSPRVGGKTMSSPGMSPAMSPSTGSMDWFGQMPQMVYDGQIVTTHNQQIHNQAMSYEQMSLEHQMMAHNQRNNQQQQQQQGTLYMRSPRAAQEPGFSGSVTLVIQGLPAHADVALLHDLCAPYGRILSAQIDVDASAPIPQDGQQRTGMCSGRGRVQMAGLAQAQYATQALNGAIIFEGGRPLQVSIAYSGGARSSTDQASR